MGDENDPEMRMAALCKRLGRTWAGTKVAVMDWIVLKRKIEGMLSHIIWQISY